MRRNTPASIGALRKAYALMKWTPPSHQRHHNVPSVPDGLAGDKQEEESELLTQRNAMCKGTSWE